MADGEYSFEVKADGSQAEDAVERVERKIVNLQAALVKAGQVSRDEQGRFLASGQAAADGFRRSGDAAQDAGSHVGELIALAAGYFGAHELSELTDGYVDISNRIRATAVDQANLNGLLDATYGVAQHVRVAWEDVASTYQRLSTVTKGLGLSQEEVLHLTQEMAEGARVSGATTREAGAAMAELTHAFATGAVQGREFRVLMRDVPGLMHELQVASGETQSKFAEMGKHGQISAQMLIEWFGKADADIQEKFGRTIPTISDMVTKLHNAAEKFFGETAVGTGVMRALGEAVDFIVAHMDTFGKILLGVGQAVVGLYAISKVVSLVQALTAAISANPLMALIAAVTIAVALLRQFGDEIDIDSTGVAKLSDVFSVLYDYVKMAAAAILDFVENAWDKLTGAFSSGLKSEGIEFSLKNVLLLVASFADAAIGIFKFIGDSVVTVFGGIPVVIAKGFEILLNDIIDAYNKLKGVAIQAMYTAMPGGEMKQMLDVSADKMYAERLAAARAAGRPVDATALQRSIEDTTGGVIGRAGGAGVDHVNLGLGDDVVKQFTKKFSDDWAADVKGTSTVKDMVDGFFGEVEKRAIERSLNEKPKAPGTVSSVRGEAEPTEMTEAQRKAMEKLANELRSIMEQTNPVTEALVKLAHAQDVVDQSVSAGLISWAQGATAMENYRAKLDDQIHPFEMLVSKLIEAQSKLRDNTDEQARAAQMEQLQDEAKKKGIELTDVQLKQLDHLVAVGQQRSKLAQAEQQFTEQILGPQRSYVLNMQAIDDLQSKGKITAEDYARAQEKIKDAFAASTTYGQSAEYGLISGFHAIRDQVVDVAGTIKSAMVNAFNGINQAITDLVVKGTADWHAMVQSMLSDLTQLILKQLELRMLMAIAPGSFGTPVPLPAFAGGGSFVVGGSGYTDNQLIAFRGQPGERVTVESNRRSTGSASSGGGGGHTTVINTFDHKQAALAALNSPEGANVLMNFIAQNAQTIRGHITRR